MTAGWSNLSKKPGWFGNDILASYFAGIVDGEGTIGITKCKGRYTILVAINMCDKDALDELSKLFNKKLMCCQRKESHRPIYAWKVHSRKAELMLRWIYPFLRIKKPQADVALKFRDSIRDGNVMSRGLNRNPEKDSRILSFRIGLKEKITKLNRRGVDYEARV